MRLLNTYTRLRFFISQSSNVIGRSGFCTLSPNPAFCTTLSPNPGLYNAPCKRLRFLTSQSSNVIARSGFCTFSPKPGSLPHENRNNRPAQPHPSAVADMEGMTPLKQRKRTELENTFASQEQRNRRAHVDEACSETKMTELENALAEIVGLDDLKIQIQKWANGMLLDERRRTLGLKVGSRRAPHMVFLGNPGAGKTMVARLLGRLLHMVGLLPTDRVTEVQRSDLVGEYIGQTGAKTREKIREAEGGILFVDEAYQLIQPQGHYEDSGIEALEEIMSVMDSGKVVVIFAGYSEPMKRLITSNEGFSRRVTKVFQFNDYTSEDLAKIARIKMSNQEENCSLYGFTLHSSCSIDAIATLIQKETTDKQRRESNAGLVDTMLVNAREHLDQRLDTDCMDDELQTITLQDLEAGLKLLTQ